jgi:Family of unknown function (DUF6186)
MNSHDFTIAVYSLLALFGVGLEVRSRNPASRVPSLRAVIRRVMRTRSGRVGIMAGWAWLGLHYFAR